MLRKAAFTVALALLAAVPDATAAPTGSPTEITRAVPTPWEVVPMPDGRTLVTSFESPPGDPHAPTVRIIEADLELREAPAFVDTEVGLTPRKFLGLVRSPTVANRLYLYETVTPSLGPSRSRILTLTYDPASGDLTRDGVLFDGIGSDLNHDGGRMVFGPDDRLYVTTGDIHDPDLPGDPDSLNGKVLRIQEDGAADPANPWNDNPVPGEARDYVFSLGHRHPQGLAFVAGTLWEDEHGPSGELHAPDGATRGHDEVNVIRSGGDFGWPAVAGDLALSGTLGPEIHSGPAPAWAPGDLAYAAIDGLLYAPALNGQHLHVFERSGDHVARHGVLYGTDCIGRMRTAVIEDDQSHMWLTTDESTERILRVPMQAGDAGVVWSTGQSPAPNRFSTTACPDPVDEDKPPPVTTATSGPIRPPPPLAQLPGPVLAPPVSPASRAVALARRLRAATARLGLRGLVRRGGVGVRAGGFDAGSRVAVRVVLRRPGRSALTVATGQVRPVNRAPVTVRVRLGRRGRAALRRATTARLTVRVVYTPPGGAPVTRAAAATVRR